MSALSTCKSFQSLSMIFHTWASSFLFANGKVPRTQIAKQKKHPELAVAKCGKCLPFMSQQSGFALLFSGIWMNQIRQSELHTSMTSAAWLDKDSLRNLSTRFLSGNPMARGTVMRCVFLHCSKDFQESNTINTQILCEANKNVSRKFVIHTNTLELCPKWVQKDVGWCWLSM